METCPACGGDHKHVDCPTKLKALIKDMMAWCEYWLGDYPEKYVGPHGADSLEHWKIKAQEAVKE